MKKALFVSAASVLLAMSAPAYAQQAVSATADLNMRSGPGPQYPIIGVIAVDGQVQLEGCMQGSKWCMVNYNGAQGWAYSDYLIADVSGREVILTERVAEVPAVTYNGPAAGSAVGAATGVIAGALIGGPIGAAVGGVAGAATGSVAGAIVEPTPAVRTYVQTNRMDPVYLEGEVVVGATLPPSVEIREIPDYEYRYVYVNEVPVLVEPQSRRIVHVIR